MNVETPDKEDAGLGASLGMMQEQMSEMICELRDALTDVKMGELGDTKQGARITSDLRQWLRLALEVEMQIAKFKQRQSGIVHDFALDLDEARDSISRRLASLRGARGGA